MSADKALSEFLDAHVCKDKNLLTHTSLKTYGRWTIDDAELSKFYELYATAIKDNPFLEMNIVEKIPLNGSPIIVDLEFTFENEKDIKINNNNIDKVVRGLTSILHDMFCGDKNYTCIVMQRPKTTTDRKYGIHIQFPYIVCEKQCHNLLKEEFIRTCDVDFGYGEYMYDFPLWNWFMYFSTKPGKEPYEITKIYNNEILNANYQKNNSLYETVDMLSVRNKNHLLIQ